MAENCLLVVDDEPISLESLVENLRDEGYVVVAAATGAAAWAEIGADPGRFDAIVLDRMLPDMDGIDILRRLKGQPGMPYVPVIMQTGMAADADVADGVRAGAYYYLTKPFSADTLLAIVGAALKDAREHRELAGAVRGADISLACLREATFAFRTPEEARELATRAAGMAPDPGRVVLGLSELLINAIEHGNLAIGYAEKTRLLEENRLADEIARRLAAPEQQGRYAELRVWRGDGELCYRVRDQGTGFDWLPYLEMSSDRAFDTHGRGIALSRMLSFDRLEYQGCGNEVLAQVRV